jgi:hypothetical protein|tara:strand:+ start:342 stop:545 length:204 start_codon:yes stop_codon:yes gene_type:complete
LADVDELIRFQLLVVALQLWIQNVGIIIAQQIDLKVLRPSRSLLENMRQNLFFLTRVTSKWLPNKRL